MKQRLLARFLRYVKIDTQSQDGVEQIPSTPQQVDLARLLAKELKELGAKKVTLDKHGYVMATIPATTREQAPRIGLIAHLDTSPAVSGKGVKPQVIRAYRGGDIVIDKKNGIVIAVKDNKALAKCLGHTIVTSDGTTLLGADDKAGVAAIMTVVEELLAHPEIPHGDVKIAFTPDEEVGRGADLFDIKKFGADFAYTIDGGFEGELNQETFSADAAVIVIEGRDIHPGTAKNVMVNSMRAMADVISLLPQDMAPETTAGHAPFIHPSTLEGNVGKTTCRLILRDFRTSGLAEQRKILEEIIATVQKRHPKAKFDLTITPSYRNMRDALAKTPQVTDRLWKAAKRAGVIPRWKPIRGGTDGARLTAMGLPTPNLFMGGGNYHSRTEWVSIDQLVKTCQTAINVVRED